MDKTTAYNVGIYTAALVVLINNIASSNLTTFGVIILWGIGIAILIAGGILVQLWPEGGINWPWTDVKWPWQKEEETESVDESR